MGMGGGGQSQTTKSEYMPQDVDLRQLGLNYARTGLGQNDGAGFYGQSPAANMDPWVQNVRNQYMQSLGMNMPQNYGDWQQGSQQAANFNPMIGIAQQQMPQAQGYNEGGLTNRAISGAASYWGPGGQGGAVNTPGGVAYDPTVALEAAKRNLSQVVGPGLANAGVSEGSNPMSGAYAEAMTNAGTQMAMPINQQIMQNQANWYQPQLQGAIQGGLAQQGAQNQFMGQGLGASLQGNLAQQNAQNQFMGQGYGGMLQGGLNQQQNVFNQAMQSPAAYNQIMQGLQGNMGTQMGLANMDQQQQMAEYMRRQGLWQQSVSGMYGGGGMQPISQTTNTGGGGFNMGGALGGMGGGAAMGAMMGAPAGGIGALPGAMIGGLGGLFSGGFCWIADALYGEDSEEAQAARAWVSEGWQGEEADEFREWYEMHGQQVAHALAYDEDFAGQHEDTYRELFDDFVAFGRGYLAHAA